MKKTLVLGASPNQYRISHSAVQQLASCGHEVIAVGNKPGYIGHVPILTDPPNIHGVHTVTLYLNREIQAQYETYLLELKPKRIIFNPGTENEELAQRATRQGIETIEACTLVMLSLGVY